MGISLSNEITSKRAIRDTHPNTYLIIVPFLFYFYCDKQYFMDDKRRVRILRSVLETILAEAKEPIIKVYAQSALDETVEEIKEPNKNSHCTTHKWFGASDEKCPLCLKQNL